MARHVVLVAGPPCAGKTSYMAARARPGDRILDQDMIGAAAMRRALADVERMAAGTAWVVRCAPGPARRGELARRLGAQVVLLVPHPDELTVRATVRRDPRRTIRTIGEWFATEARDPAPRAALLTQPAAKRSTADRGYGADHQRLRRALLPSAYGQACGRCGELMLPGQPLDLDHTEDRSGYRGMAHQHCNRAAGTRKRNAVRAPMATSRQW